MIKVGLQACSVTEPFLAHPDETIHSLARSGYRYIESAGTMFTDRLQASLADIRKRLDWEGIAHTAKHFNSISIENVEKEISMLQILGGSYIVLASDFFESKEEVLAKCELYNQAGKLCAEEGKKFVYHNHAHEFQLFDGKPALELILENTDPKLVHFEMDVMWIYRGGYNPVNVLRKFGKRVKLLHLNDFHSKFQNRRSFFDGLEPGTKITGEFYGRYNIDVAADIGEGILDIQSILDAANRYTSAEYGFVELSGENSRFKPDMLAAAQFGFHALNQYNGLSF